MQDQSKDLILSLPQGADFQLDHNTIASLEQAETVEAPQFENWDVKKCPKIRAVFIGAKTEWFPSLKNGAAEGEKEPVETVFFKAIIDGKPKNMYCAARQFVRKISEMQAVFPEGTNFPFAAEFLGEEKGKKFKYSNFSLSFLKTK
jgi:hypothetical protein